MSMTHCWTAMGRSLLVTALVDSYQIWDVEAIGGPGRLLRHSYQEHYVHCLAFAWDSDFGEGDLRLLQHWQGGYYITSYKIFEFLRGGLSLVGCGQEYIVRGAGLQCYRHCGSWVTVSLGRSPPDLTVKLRLNNADPEGIWASAEGRVAPVIGFKGWTVDVGWEAARAARGYGG